VWTPAPSAVAPLRESRRRPVPAYPARRGLGRKIGSLEVSTSEAGLFSFRGFGSSVPQCLRLTALLSRGPLSTLRTPMSSKPHPFFDIISDWLLIKPSNESWPPPPAP
jgi:hypothetical protein